MERASGHFNYILRAIMPLAIENIDYVALDLKQAYSEVRYGSGLK